MKVTITIDDTDNDAFGEGAEDHQQEVCRILRSAVRLCEGAVWDRPFDFVLRDANGNKVGTIEVSK